MRELRRRGPLVGLALCALLLLATPFAAVSSAAATPNQTFRTISTGGPETPDPIAPAGPDPLAAFRAAHPAARWPHWFSDQKLAWTALGLDAGGDEATLATDGTLSPRQNVFGVSLWLRDDATGVLYTPQLDQVQQALDSGDLPLVTTRWTVPGATLASTVFAASDGADPITAAPGDHRQILLRATLTTSGTPHPWTIYVALRPFGPAGGGSPIHAVAATATTLTADGNLALVAQQSASRYGALNEQAVDASLPAAAGKVPTATSATSTLGMAEGLLAYDLKPASGQPTTLSFALPMSPTPPSLAAAQRLAALDTAALRARVAAAWQARLHRVTLDLPANPDIADAFYASLGYISMARTPNELYSGPLSERAFWFRDAAYITDALDKAGEAASVQPILRLMAASQLPSGRYPPIVEADGVARQPLKTEWDAQGEVIYAFVEYAKQTHDLGFLRSVYPGIWRAVRFQAGQLAAARVPALRNTPFFGLLPAGESAEDLYSADWHHYWDDFWALTGFREAADAATLLGYGADAARMTADGDALKADVLASIGRLNAKGGDPYIPNGPEDTTTTAMARSATPALWPLPVLDPQSALVQNSFQKYYKSSVQPYGGGYQHYNGHLWPYAGLSLAHAFYELGWMDDVTQMLDWAMQHQTAPHLYAWAEIVRPDNFSFALGDMPHSWMAAEYILLIRDMLIHEHANQLAIGPMPSAWLPPGGRIHIAAFPTAFGPASYTLTRSADGLHFDLTLDGPAPPGGWTFTVAPDLAAQSYTIDGAAAQDATGDTITIPAGARQVQVAVTER